MRKVEYAIPPLLLKAIKGMYTKCRSSVRTAQGLGQWFEVKTTYIHTYIYSFEKFDKTQTMTVKTSEYKI